MNSKTKLFFLILGILVQLSSNAFAGYPFYGNIDLQKKQFNINFGRADEDGIGLNLDFSDESQYRFNLNLEHIKTSVFEISTQLDGALKWERDEIKAQRFLQGQIATHYSLLNYKPVDDLVGQFEINNQVLSLTSLATEKFNLNGTIELFPPYKMDLTLHLSHIPMKDFLVVWTNTDDFNTEGLVSGKIQIAGISNHILVNANLESSKGVVDELDFEAIVLNMEGPYPVLLINNSTVSQSNGMSFNVDGYFDLSNKSYKRQIKDLNLSPVVQKGDSQWEWTIKQKADQEAEADSEFKYFLRKKESSGVKDGSDMMGVEQKLKF